MWILTTSGFYSIVEKPEDKGTPFLTVRARVRADLVRLLNGVPERRRPKILKDDVADYMFRARVRRGVVANLLHEAVEGISYPNFKDRIKAVQGAERARFYERVWTVLVGLQPGRRFGNLWSGG